MVVVEHTGQLQAISLIVGPPTIRCATIVLSNNVSVECWEGREISDQARHRCRLQPAPRTQKTCSLC